MRRDFAFRAVVRTKDDQRILKLTGILKRLDELGEHIVHVHHAVAEHGTRSRLSRPVVRRIVIEMAAARGVVEEEWLLAVLHLLDKVYTVVHPVPVQVFDISKVDQLDVFALFGVDGTTMHLVMTERSFFHHFEAGWA